MKLVKKCTHILNRLCPSPDKYRGRHAVTVKQRPHLRKTHGNKETPVCLVGEQVGGSGLPAQYPALDITKNREQVPLCCFFLTPFPCQFIKKPPLLCAPLEMPFQHRMAAPSSLPVSPRRPPPCWARPVSTCWVEREALIQPQNSTLCPMGWYRPSRARPGAVPRRSLGPAAGGGASVRGGFSTAASSGPAPGPRPREAASQRPGSGAPPAPRVPPVSTGGVCVYGGEAPA